MNQKTTEDLPKIQRRVQILTLASLRLAHAEENNVPNSEISRALRRIAINLTAAGSDLAYCLGLQAGTSNHIGVPLPMAQPVQQARELSELKESALYDGESNHVGDFPVTPVTKRVAKTPVAASAGSAPLSEETAEEVEEDGAFDEEEWTV